MIPSRRQLELLARHSSGMTFTELGVEFCISRQMVDKEFCALRLTLGAVNLYHAQALALASGYLAVDGREGALFVVEERLAGDLVAA